MKKFFGVPVLFAVLLLTSLQIFSQDLPQVLAIRELKLRPGINEIAFQNYYNKWCKNISKSTKGVNAWIMKGDRGGRVDKYDMVWGFNYTETRDYYFPVSDSQNYPKWNAALERFQFQAPPEPLVEDMNDYTDFIVVGYDAMLNPQLGEVVSLNYPVVNHGMEKELENFVTTDLNNALQKNIDGYYIYLLKGDRGEFKGKYVILKVFDTYNRRKLYFPEDTDVPSADFTKAGKKVTNDLQKFKTYFESSPAVKSSDFVILY